MDSNNVSNNENNIPQKEEIIIPPEPTKQPEVPSTFNSPALFVKQETNEKKTKGENPASLKVVNHTKTILIVVGVFLFLAIGIFSIVQISLDQKYTLPIFNENQTEQPLEDVVLNEEEVPDTASECGGSPFVKIISPDANQTFAIGDTINFRIEICGIGASLFSKATIEYFEKDTGSKVGDFSLDCITPPGTFENNIQTISWQVPPFLEKTGQQQPCFIPTVNFLKPYTYQLRVEYASGSYKDTGDVFLIDGENYVYVPPQFSEYVITSDISFERSPFIDSSAPDFLKEIIFPAYFEAPPLFANYYRWFVLANGPAFLIDLRDGMAHPSPATSGKVFTKPLSTLYVSENPLSENDKPETGQTHRVRWYNFDEETKSFETIVERLCIVKIGISENTYNDCIPTE
jgi:hypothetical protein